MIPEGIRSWAARFLIIALVITTVSGNAVQVGAIPGKANGVTSGSLTTQTIAPSYQTVTVNVRDPSVAPQSSGSVLSLTQVGFSGTTEIFLDSFGSASFQGVIGGTYYLTSDPYVKKKVGNIYVENNLYLNNAVTIINIKNGVGANNVVLNLENVSGPNFINLTGSIIGGNGEMMSLRIATFLEGVVTRNLGKIGTNPFQFALRVHKNIGPALISLNPSTTSPTTGYSVSPTVAYQTILNNDITGVDFTVKKPTLQYKINVTDQRGSPIKNAKVSIYAPSSSNAPQNGNTDASGSVIFLLQAGTYNFSAQTTDGIRSAESSFTLLANSTGKILINIPDTRISGTVYAQGDTLSPLTNVSMYAISASGTYQPISTTTDSSGAYSMLVGNGIWKVGGATSSFGKLNELTVNVQNASSTGNDFIVDTNILVTVTGSVQLSSNSAGVAGVSITAKSKDGNITKDGNSITDQNGEFNMRLKPGSYTLSAFGQGYGIIGNIDIPNIVSDRGGFDFLIADLFALNVNLSGGVPTDSSTLEWIIDLNDPTNGKGFSRIVRGSLSGIFNSIQSGTYSVKVGVTGIGEVYSSGAYRIASDSYLNIDIPIQNALNTLKGYIYEKGTGSPVSDAYVELKDSVTKQINWTKSDVNGLYEILASAGTSYELLSKKPGYETSQISTGVLNMASQSKNIELKPISNTITVIGRLYDESGNPISDDRAFISLQGLNGDNTQNQKWYGKEMLLSSGSFKFDGVPGDFGTGILKIATNSYSLFMGGLRNYTANVNVGSMMLGSLPNPNKTSIASIKPIEGGVVGSLSEGIRLLFPNGALGNGLDPASVTYGDTTGIPHTLGAESIGGKAKEIKATDSSGNPVNTLNNDVTLEISYSGSTIVATKPSITVDEVRNLQLAYYEASTYSWITIPTIMTSSDPSLLDNASGSLLLSQLPGYESLIFHLKGQTNHFTLFTSLVSTAVKNSSSSSGGGGPKGGGNQGGGGGGGGTEGTPENSGSGKQDPDEKASITTGIATTIHSISDYLGNVEQSIALNGSGILKDSLTVTRDGKTVDLTQILMAGATTISNTSKNLVSFAVGDTLASKNGKLDVSLGGYTKMKISENSVMKIASVGENYLTFENVAGTVKYDFTKRNNGEYQYKVTGKTGYATIRGTVLTVTSGTDSETYDLIRGKIDVYNRYLNKTVSMVGGEKYVIYSNKNEQFYKNGVLQGKGSIPYKLFADVGETHGFFKFIKLLSDKGIVKGYSDGNFYPGKYITRAELLGMTVKSSNTPVSYDSRYTYNDINQTDWWAAYVSTAKKLGYISSSNAKFESGRDITRAEALSIIMKFKKVPIKFDSGSTYADIKTTDWWAAYVSTAKKLGYISPTNKEFRPGDPITRGEITVILYNVFFK